MSKVYKPMVCEWEDCVIVLTIIKLSVDSPHCGHLNENVSTSVGTLD